jgi:hypothetical protein
MLPGPLRVSLMMDAYRIVLKDSQIFKKNFSQQVLQEMIPIIQEQRFLPGDCIFGQGDLQQDKENAIHFIQTGCVEVYNDNA